MISCKEKLLHVWLVFHICQWSGEHLEKKHTIYHGDETSIINGCVFHTTIIYHIHQCVFDHRVKLVQLTVSANFGPFFTGSPSIIYAVVQWSCVSASGYPDLRSWGAKLVKLAAIDILEWSAVWARYQQDLTLICVWILYHIIYIIYDTYPIIS